MTDYNELVKALRIVEKEQDCNECEAGRWHHDFNCCLFANAADAIEALQAQLPKRGEWIHVEGDEPWEWRCTACHKIAEGLGEFRFCPNCGAKMEVQDGYK